MLFYPVVALFSSLLLTQSALAASNGMTSAQVVTNINVVATASFKLNNLLGSVSTSTSPTQVVVISQVLPVHIHQGYGFDFLHPSSDGLHAIPDHYYQSQ